MTLARKAKLEAHLALHREQPPGASGDPTVLPHAQPDQAAGPARPDTSTADTEAFLAALRSLGGQVGNTRLRQQLGWNETTYEAAKQSLIDSGHVRPGRGRGGSVALSGPDRSPT